MAKHIAIFVKKTMKFDPKYLLGGVLGVPRRQNWPQEGPGLGQRGAKGIQEGLKEGTKAPKEPQRAPQGRQYGPFGTKFRGKLIKIWLNFVKIWYQ